MTQSATNTVRTFIDKARREPIGVDVSDWSDEWVAGFLAGQASILEEVAREPERHGIRLLAPAQWLEDRADHYDAEARMLRDVGEARMGLIFEVVRDELRKCVGEMEA